MEALLADAHVFVTNVKPDVLDRFGLDAESTAARHPHLVYCAVSGYGLAGPDRDRPSYDVGAFWARSGLAYQLAADDEPLNARGALGDHVTALSALAAILAGVLQQRATGEGCIVETSLLRTGMYMLGWDYGLQTSLGKVARMEPRDEQQSPLMNSYRTADGRWLFLTCLEADRHLPNVLAAFGSRGSRRRRAVRRRPGAAEAQARRDRGARRGVRDAVRSTSGRPGSTRPGSGGRR